MSLNQLAGSVGTLGLFILVAVVAVIAWFDLARNDWGWMYQRRTLKSKGFITFVVVRNTVLALLTLGDWWYDHWSVFASIAATIMLSILSIGTTQVLMSRDIRRPKLPREDLVSFYSAITMGVLVICMFAA